MDDINVWFNPLSEDPHFYCVPQLEVCQEFIGNSYLAESISHLQLQDLNVELSESKDPFSNALANSDCNELDEIDEGGGGKRDNNTVFKTSLSQFRKSILDLVKKSPSLDFLKREIKAIYGAKNQSVFPKLLSMVRALRKQKQVSSFWELRKQKLINKKVSLLKVGKYTQKRLNQLQKTIKMMDESLIQLNLQKSFDIYWGRYKQHEKYERCKKQVKEFDAEFRRRYEEKEERSLRSRRVEAQRGGKSGKLYQNKSRKNNRRQQK